MSTGLNVRDVVEIIREKHRNRNGLFREDDGEWVTIRGTHVEIDDETGAITKGPERLKTMNKPERGRASVGKKVLNRIRKPLDELYGTITSKGKVHDDWEEKYEWLKERKEGLEQELNEQREFLKENRERAKKYPEDYSYYENKYHEVGDKISQINRQIDEATTQEEKEKLKKEYEEARKELYKWAEPMNELANIPNLERVIAGYEKRIHDVQEVIDETLEEEPESVADLHTKYDEYAKQRNKAVLMAFSSVDECKTSQDVSDYLRAKQFFKPNSREFDNDQRANLDTMDVNSAKASVGVLEKFMSDYPQLKGKLPGIDCHDMSGDSDYRTTLAYSDPIAMVCYNQDFFRTGGDGPETYRRCVERKFHPPGTDYASIIDHEFAHSVERLMQRKLGKKDRISNIIMKRAMKAVDGEYRKDREDEVRKSVCLYAARNEGIFENPRTGKLKENKNYGRNTEFIAECMAEARRSPNPRPYALAVRAEFEKLMKEAGLL